MTSYALAIRLLRLERIEVGGDALNKWHFARQWFHEFDVTQVEWDHHLARLGVNVPLGILQLLLGRGAMIYYVAAVGTFVLTALLVYLIGRLARDRASGLLATIWFVSFPSWNRAGSQVSPDAFGAAYIALAMLCLLGYERTTRSRLAWLCASSLAAALAYLAKEPLAAFVGGGMVATFLISRSYRDAAIYGAIPIAVLGIETVFYRTVSHYSSRLALVTESHGNNVIGGFLDVFKRYTTLPGYWLDLLACALAGAILLPLLTRSRRMWPLIWLPLSFFGFYTFAIKSLHPLALWSRFLPRYLDAAVPFAALLAATFLVTCFELGTQRFLPRLAALLGRAERVGALAGCLLLGALGMRAYLRDPPNRRHPLVFTPKVERVLNDAYRRGLPIASLKGPPSRRRLALKAAYKLYIDDRQLVVNGRLPNWNSVATPNDRLVRPGAAAPRRGCEVEVWAVGNVLHIQQLEPLPRSCD